MDEIHMDMYKIHRGTHLYIVHMYIYIYMHIHMYRGNENGIRTFEMKNFVSLNTTGRSS